MLNKQCKNLRVAFRPFSLEQAEWLITSIVIFPFKYSKTNDHLQFAVNRPKVRFLLYKEVVFKSNSLSLIGVFEDLILTVPFLGGFRIYILFISNVGFAV